MSQGPENRFIAGVHRLLKGKCHFEKMHNPYRGGTADVWYSGKSGDCWIEYKWLNHVPKRGTVKPELSDLQREWLRDRYQEGRTVFVIVGCPAGGIVFPTLHEWEHGNYVSQITIQPKKEIASEILKLVGPTSEKPIEDSKGHKRRPNRDVVAVQDRSNVVHAVRVNKVRSDKEEK